MALKQFISLENLSTYHDNISQVISDGDAKAIKAAALNGKKLELYTVENPTAQDQPRFSITLPFTQQEIIGPNGVAKVLNESDGGGIFFERNNNLKSFVGVNDGDAGDIAAQIYAINTQTKQGTRINVTTNGIYYTNGATSPAFTTLDEIATKRDIQGDAGSKTVYVVETSGGVQDQFSKKYDFYQGANGSAQNPDPSEKITTISIAKDMFVESGTVGTVTTADVPYPGAKVGDKYIDIVLANATSDHIYIPANDLVDIYTGGTTSDIQISIDNNNKITAVLVDGSIGKSKLDSVVNSSLDAADSALQPEDIESVDTEDIENLFN